MYGLLSRQSSALKETDSPVGRRPRPVGSLRLGLSGIDCMLATWSVTSKPVGVSSETQSAVTSAHGAALASALATGAGVPPTQGAGPRPHAGSSSPPVGSMSPLGSVA